MLLKPTVGNESCKLHEASFRRRPSETFGESATLLRNAATVTVTAAAPLTFVCILQEDQKMEILS